MEEEGGQREKREVEKLEKEGEGSGYREKIEVKENSNVTQGYKNVVKYHGGKMYRAVTELYPDVGLQPSRFKCIPPFLTNLSIKIIFI